MKLIKPASVEQEMVEIATAWDRKPARGLPGLFGFTEPDYDKPLASFTVAGRTSYSTCIIDFENDPIPFYDVNELRYFDMKNPKVDLRFDNLTYYGVWTYENLCIRDNIYECHVDYIQGN